MFGDQGVSALGRGPPRLVQRGAGAAAGMASGVGAALDEFCRWLERQRAEGFMAQNHHRRT